MMPRATITINDLPGAKPSASIDKEGIVFIDPIVAKRIVSLFEVPEGAEPLGVILPGWHFSFLGHNHIGGAYYAEPIAGYVPPPPAQRAPTRLEIRKRLIDAVAHVTYPNTESALQIVEALDAHLDARFVIKT